jgi:hypothetical protein
MTTELERPEDRETLAALERSLPRVRPPDELLGRIIAEVAPEATVVPLRPAGRARRWAAPVAAVAAAAAAAAVLVAVLTGGEGLGSPDARAAISGKSAPAVHGEALLYDGGGEGGTVQVTLRDVPPAPSGHHYEVWVLPEGSTAMESLGTFTESGETVELELDLPAPGPYAAVDVSVEEDAGPAAHSDTSLAGGTFE